MADIFTVIADPTRRELLRLLLGGLDGAGSSSGHSSASTPVTAVSRAEISVGHMVAALGLSQPTVSKHLRVLREAGLVHVRDEGQHRYYSVDSAPLDAVEAWLRPFVGPVPESAADTGAPAPKTTPVSIPAPLRRAAENLPDVGDVGATLGRVAAGAQSRFLQPVKKRLGHREQGYGLGCHRVTCAPKVATRHTSNTQQPQSRPTLSSHAGPNFEAGTCRTI